MIIETSPRMSLRCKTNPYFKRFSNKGSYNAPSANKYRVYNPKHEGENGVESSMTRPTCFMSCKRRDVKCPIGRDG